MFSENPARTIERFGGEFRPDLSVEDQNLKPIRRMVSTKPNEMDTKLKFESHSFRNATNLIYDRGQDNEKVSLSAKNPEVFGQRCANKYLAYLQM